MKMLRLLWLAVMMALACGKDASGPDPIPPGPTLRVTNHAYQVVCAPVCQPAAPIDPVFIAVLPTTDTGYIVMAVAFDSTYCVRLSGRLGEKHGWVVSVAAYSLYGQRYITDATDLSGAGGWEWSIRDSLTGVSPYSYEHKATFGPTAPCANPYIIQ